MKQANRGLILLSVLVFALSAFADTNKAEFSLTEPAMLANVELPPGDYVVRWEESGAEVPVTILRNGRGVTTTKAQVLEQEGRYRQPVLLFERQSPVKKLTRIDLRKQALVFEKPAESAAR
jgi:hypothetical protein